MTGALIDFGLADASSGGGRAAEGAGGAKGA